MTETTGGLSTVLKRGAAMAAIGVAVSQAATVVQTIVLGRLLGPDEIGAFTAGTVLVGFLVLFAQGALSQALIYRRADIEDAANTALIVTFGTGLLLGLAVLAASPLIGALFHSSRVGLIAAATSGLMVLHVWASVPDALMQRAFQFKRQMIIAPVVSIVFAGVSIMFALNGFGAWAMVIGWYASTTSAVVLSWWMAKWRPFRGRFSFRLWREMAAFSLPMLLDGLAERSREAAEQVIVGRALGTVDLGQYRYAYRLASLPSLIVVMVCAHVLFPAFSRIADDKERFRAAFLRALGWIWFAALPITALLIVEGQSVVVLLLGNEWRAAGATAAAMAGIGLGAALMSVTGEAMKGAGRSSLLNWMTGLSLGLGLPLILVCLPFGLTGVGIAISTTYVAVGLVSVGLASRVVGVSRHELVGCLVPPVISALIALAVLLPLEQLLVHSDRHQGLPGLFWVAAQSALFSVLYVGGLRWIGSARYRSVLDAAGRVVTKSRGYTRQLVGRS